LTFDIDRLLRQLKPEKRKLRLSARGDLLGAATATWTGPLLLDTCVYIDAGRGRLPAEVEALLVGRRIVHCATVAAELALGLAMLDPLHADTLAQREFLRDTLARMAAGKIITPDATTWTTAAVLAGTLARLQGIRPDDRRRRLADALIAVTARAEGCAVLTANRTDFDLIAQLLPGLRAIVYSSAS